MAEASRTCGSWARDARVRRGAARGPAGHCAGRCAGRCAGAGCGTCQARRVCARRVARRGTHGRGGASGHSLLHGVLKPLGAQSPSSSSTLRKFSIGQLSGTRAATAGAGHQMGDQTAIKWR